METLSPPGSPQSLVRPRASTAMSHVSTHSHRSSRSKEDKKSDLVETSQEKRRLKGKADPMKALHEAQPAAVALEDSTIESVRAVQYRDREGNVIADPDKSNPTRPRMERPLDTIRSFNAAAEGTTSRRSSYQRQPSQFNGYDGQSRRSSSYYGNPNTSYAPNSRGPPGRGQGGYYNNNNNNRNSAVGHRPDQSDLDYHQSQGYSRHQRFQSAPMSMETQMNQNQLQPQMSHISQHAHQQSYETMNTNISGSGSEEMSKSTNPSSQNSSYDQLHQVGRKPDEIYNSHRPNGSPSRGQYPPSAMMNNGNHHTYQQPQQYPQQHRQQPQWDGRRVDEYGMEISDRPTPPPKHSFISGARDVSPSNGGKGDKRQSWLKRTFSKKAL